MSKLETVGKKNNIGKRETMNRKDNMDKIETLDKIDKFRKRAKELVAKMTLEEKASQLTYQSPAVKRLGIPAYNWWNEALHGVARAGTATSFPQAIALAAAFDEVMVEQIAEAIAEEGRAKYNAASAKEDRDIYKGLTFWSPNVNIFRDPRWGRGHETYGEDPWLSGRLGIAFIKGLQGNGSYLKAAACAKHFAVHSGPEDLRHEFDAIVSDKDLWETYLPAFEACVKEGGVEAVMGAYNRTNGEPCCGSYFLLKDILRDTWSFQGHVVSDCWAIKDFHMYHGVTETPEESAALAIDAGCDLNCGNIYLYLLKAQQKGLITEEHITRAAERLFTTRFRLGLFDQTEYDDISYEQVECKKHIELAVESARRSMVLLKNNNILPLDKKQLKTIGIIGPNANSRLALKGNYYGTSSRYITILEGIQDEVGDDVRILYSRGCELSADRTEVLAHAKDRISEAVTVAEHSDVVFLCLGLDETLEGEELDEGNNCGSGDKADLRLPEPQRILMKAVKETKKPVILCMVSGSCMDLTYADEHFDAILQLWYPGARGGRAAADLLFGNCSPSGKLPVTFYRNLEGMPQFTDYSMKNRTYRYYTGTPLYPFGYGLTYGDADCVDAILTEHQDELQIDVTVKNNSSISIQEVIQIYIKPHDTPFAPLGASLCGCTRISLAGGEVKKIPIRVSKDALLVVNEEGQRVRDTNQFIFYAGFNQPDQRSISLTGKEPISIVYSPEG